MLEYSLAGVTVVHTGAVVEVVTITTSDITTPADDTTDEKSRKLLVNSGRWDT